MAFYVRDGGVWKDPTGWSVKDAGVWKEATQMYARDGGVWKPLLSSAPTANIARPGVTIHGELGEYMTNIMPITGAATDLTRYTVSVWVERNSNNMLGGNGQDIIIGNGFTLGFWIPTGTTRVDFRTANNPAEVHLETNHTTGSPGIWNEDNGPHHVLFTFDSTQRIISQRARMWLDGIEITAWLVDSRSQIPMDSETVLFDDNEELFLSTSNTNASEVLRAILADVYVIDGTSITDPSEFAYDLGAGLRPVAYGGALGNRGWHLDFALVNDLGNDAGPNMLDFVTPGIDSTNYVTPYL